MHVNHKIGSEGFFSGNSLPSISKLSISKLFIAISSSVASEFDPEILDKLSLKNIIQYNS